MGQIIHIHELDSAQGQSVDRLWGKTVRERSGGRTLGEWSHRRWFLAKGTEGRHSKQLVCCSAEHPGEGRGPGAGNVIFGVGWGSREGFHRAGSCNDTGRSPTSVAMGSILLVPQVATFLTRNNKGETGGMSLLQMGCPQQQRAGPGRTSRCEVNSPRSLGRRLNCPLLGVRNQRHSEIANGVQSATVRLTTPTGNACTKHTALGVPFSHCTCTWL